MLIFDERQKSRIDKRSTAAEVRPPRKRDKRDAKPQSPSPARKNICENETVSILTYGFFFAVFSALSPSVKELYG